LNVIGPLLFRSEKINPVVAALIEDDGSSTARIRR